MLVAHKLHLCWSKKILVVFMENPLFQHTISWDDGSPLLGPLEGVDSVPILSQGSTPPHLSFRDILVVLFSTIFAGTAIFPALLYLLNETKNENTISPEFVHTETRDIH